MTTTQLLAVAATLLLAACCSFGTRTITASSFPGFDTTRLTSDQAGRLRDAESDFRRVRSRREPAHAQLEQALRDGGTKIYRGRGYDLVAHYSFEDRDGTYGQIVGPQITFGREITGGAPVHSPPKVFV